MRLPGSAPLKSCFHHIIFLLLITGSTLFLAQCNRGADNAYFGQAGGTGRDLISEEPPSALPDGALYAISLPETWNDLVIYAHGYVNPQQELALPDDLIEEGSVASIINDLGMAYATTSYRANGLVGPEAVDDLQQLVDKFIELNGRPDHIYLVGVSQGAMITTLAVEQHPDTFDGGLAACGPIGDFRRQLNYLGDFHVLFNHFFPETGTGDPSGIPRPVVDNWLGENSSLRQQIDEVLTERPGDALTLLRVAGVPLPLEPDPREIRHTVFSLFRYNLLATNNAIDRLNGSPFDNLQREYTGTGSARSDSMLNRKIKRFGADSSALVTIKNEFETSGDLSRPLVTMHTPDPEVPYWHELGYREKVFREESSGWHTGLPVIARYGHCNFTFPELLAGFAVLVNKNTEQDLVVPSRIFPNKRTERAFLEYSRQQGISPEIQSRNR